MLEATSTGSKPDLKVLEKRPVTFFSSVFSNLSIKPKRNPLIGGEIQVYPQGSEILLGASTLEKVDLEPNKA